MVCEKFANFRENSPLTVLFCFEMVNLKESRFKIDYIDEIRRSNDSKNQNIKLTSKWNNFHFRISIVKEIKYGLGGTSIGLAFPSK